jgi:hypothetical protein
MIVILYNIIDARGSSDVKSLFACLLDMLVSIREQLYQTKKVYLLTGSIDGV